MYNRRCVGYDALTQVVLHRRAGTDDSPAALQLKKSPHRVVERARLEPVPFITDQKIDAALQLLAVLPCKVFKSLGWQHNSMDEHSAICECCELAGTHECSRTMR
jgi:hypothetical protein